MTTLAPYYSSGGITIYHGDFRQILPSIAADVVVTDSPYGVGVKYASFDDTKENVSELARSLGGMLGSFSRAAIFSGVPQMWMWPQPEWVLCWSYAPATNEFSPWGFAQWQPILVYGKDPFLERCLGPRPTVFTHARPPEREGRAHPCPKPLPVMRWTLNRVSREDEIVVDPFSGSGTTLVAAKLERRRAIGIEIEERYCEIAAKRCSQGVLNFEDD